MNPRDWVSLKPKLKIDEVKTVGVLGAGTMGHGIAEM